MGNFIAWDARTGKIVWSNKEQFSVWSGVLATAGNVVFYGTLEGYLKAGGCQDRQRAFQVQDAIGHHRKRDDLRAHWQAVCCRSVRRWRLGRIGLAAGLTEPTAGLGAVGGYAALRNYTSLGGQLTVFALPAN